MKIERLNVDNLREGIFCGAGKPHKDEVYDQLEAWLDGDLLRGQIARNDDGQVAGFVIYYPIEHAPMDVEGSGDYMVQCLFVKPELQGKGVGRLLIETALADARGAGAAGLAVEGFADVSKDGFQYKPGTFFQHMGMAAVDARGQGTLYYAPFNKTAAAPRYMKQKFKPTPTSPKIRVDILDCRRCHSMVSNKNLVQTVLEQAAKPDVEVHVHNQNTRDAIVDKGMSSGVFVDGRLTFFGGPVSEDDVINAIEVAYSARKQAMDK